MVRGIERRRIFMDDEDRQGFVGRLGVVLEATSTKCYAWALMANHAHLLLRSGQVPIATVMRRLLTGHAMDFNRRHRRHGHLFQNRYKSVLCEEDPYLLELVRYIHLNPVRSKAVGSLDELELFPYSGHATLTGKIERNWQDAAYVLALFGKKVGAARQAYSEFVARGVSLGKRPELVGGGLIRSLGGWHAVKALRRGESRLKGDERILGSGDFVMNVLEGAQEELVRRHRLERQGYDLERVARRVGELFALETEEILRGGKRRKAASARSVLCYWAIKELGVTATALARRMELGQPAVSKAARRGERLVQERRLQLVEGK
jgi:REP element-mobilizing transposase RayT